MQEELLGILLPLGGEQRMTFANQSLEHVWRDSGLQFLICLLGF
jgi:hypothetical protein